MNVNCSVGQRERQVSGKGIEGGKTRSRPTPAIHGNEFDAAKRSIDWIGEAH